MAIPTTQTAVDMAKLYCPQCGCPTERLDQGYCEECSKDNQDNLDLHNINFDRWESLSDQQRDKEIKRAQV